MFNRKILQRAISIYFILFSLISLANYYPKESKYNTRRLYRLSKNIQDHLKSLKIAKDTIKVGKCPEIKDLDDLLAEEIRIYKLIKGWTTNEALSKLGIMKNVRNLKFLTLQNKIIKKDKIPLWLDNPKKSMAFFRDEMLKLEKEMESYESRLRVFNKRMQRCQRRYNVCYESLENDYTQARNREIKELIRFFVKSDEQLMANKQTLKRITSLYENNILKQKGFRSNYFIYFEKALIAQIRYRLSGKQDMEECHKAYLAWTEVYQWNQKHTTIAQKGINVQNIPFCELDYLERNSRKWKYGIIINQDWINEQKGITEQCSSHIKPCCDSKLDSIDPDKIIKSRDRYCKGCTDRLANNYCPSAEIRTQCEYAICPDSCFNEAYVERIYPGYNPLIDKLIIDPNKCLEKICGCTDPLCENYDKKFEKDDGSCDCGCLDSTAVNYALRVSPEWAKKQYYNPNVKNHDQSKCHWRGCMDPCSANYDPLAKISNDSCRCEPTTREDLIVQINALKLQIIDDAGSAKSLNKDFKARMKNTDRETRDVADQFSIQREDDNLIVEGEINLGKLSSAGYASDIGLGVYNFPPVYEVCDSLIIFLYQRTGEILFKNLEGRIIGEADGNSIRPGGITFLNNHKPILSEGFKVFLGTDNTSLNAIQSDNFPIEPTKQFSLSHGEPIHENIILAFVRAYLVKQRLRDSAPAIPPLNIKIGAKWNSRKGGDYRKISVVFIIEDYFRISHLNEYDLKEEVARIEEAIAFYDKVGYPTANIIYKKCPCLHE